MKKSRRAPLTLHRETLLPLTPSPSTLPRAAGGGLFTSNGDICSGDPRCVMSGGNIACTGPMISAPLETTG
jgi:hypothetical protein